MNTKVITLRDSNTYSETLSEVAAALRAGALVVFPTETVYGLGANGADPHATARLREVKGRSFAQPFTVHIAKRSDARRYVPNPSPLLRRLARKAWPGPLTLICEVRAPAETEIAQSCPPGQLQEIFHQGTVGLRCPDHATATRLLSQAGVPVVASSANRASRPPALEAREAMHDLDGQVDYVLDEGRTRLSAASTVVEVRGSTWQIRREGVLDERTIRRLARSEILMVCTGNSCRSPLAEYMFRHKLARGLGLSLEQLEAAGYYVTSAGTFAVAGGGASVGTLAELSQRDMDATGHRSQPLTIELIQRAERIYVMTPEHRSAVLDLVPAAATRVELLDAQGPVPDPIGGGPEQYAHCAAQIERAVEARLEEFVHEDLNW